MRLIKVIAINLIILCSLLLLIEGILWSLYPDYTYYYRTHPIQPDLEEILAKTDTSWLSPDPDLGWVCQQKTSLLFPSPPVQGVCYQINAEGFRNSFNFQDLKTKTKKRVLLVGDSFTFGIYLPEHHTIAARLQQELGPDYLVISLSIPAWGLDQMYLAYQKYIDLLNPDQVILSFVDDDLMRSLEILFHGCGRKPCLKIEQGKLVQNEDNPQWWEYLCWNNQLGNRILLGKYHKQAANLGQYLIENIFKECNQNDREIILARIPALVDLDDAIPRPQFSMKMLCEEYKVPYLELYPELLQSSSYTYRKYYIPDDGHFTESGAKYFSEKLLPILKKNPTYLVH